ncbi:MAG: imelysin family protein [Crocinitomicaceae bacterium]
MTKYYFPILLTLLFVSIGCKKKKQETDCTDSPPFDRKEMISHLTTQYIIPAYSDYKTKAKSLKDKTKAFTTVTSIDNLLACQQTWRELAESWQNVAFLEFGPAENIGLRSQTNIYPTDTNKINSNISNSNYNIALPSNYVAKGIQALDYLFFLPNRTSSDIVQYYSNSTNGKQYLESLTNELYSNASTVFSDWENSATAFINNTSDNAQGSAVSNIVNALSAHYETYVRKGKVGIPVGIFNGFSQTPMPAHSEAYYSGHSVTLLVQEMKAIKQFMNGETFTDQVNGLGLDDYMKYTEAKKDDLELSKAINNQISQIIAEANSLDSPLSEIVNSKPTESKALYQSMQKLVPLIKVDLTSALGVLITYQDNDGD